MYAVQCFLYAAAWYPLACAWQATRGTSLFHAVHWAGAAWLMWGVVLAGVADGHPDPATFTALCLTGCAGIAVLGARRPIQGPWNFVVVGLLAVMLLPMVEGLVLGAKSLDGLRTFFLAATLGIGVLNYLPTCFGPAALLLGLGCAGEMIGILAPQPLPVGAEASLVRLCWLAAPWVAWARWTPDAQRDELDRLWLDFRNRWGLVWAQRVREQCNRAAANAGWAVVLRWRGFDAERPTDETQRAAVRETMRALLSRFSGDRPK